MTKNKPLFNETTNTGKGMGSEIVLFNDDFNTFEYVINVLVEVCGHEPEQAEQVALITHYKGKCGVKTGRREELLPICLELNRRNLTAKIN
ncbi:MAG TPA: ATP-dependent Clp protease adaptor ClpS [Bacteroidales bacterium]|jgi:ATP-dependent Clp protease adaptor protein ClpS|nr:ATP-dependent Clp protease adaptor ClpS [Bacteroidales bacterium]